VDDTFSGADSFFETFAPRAPPWAAGSMSAPPPPRCPSPAPRTRARGLVPGRPAHAVPGGPV